MLLQLLYANELKISLHRLTMLGLLAGAVPGVWIM